MDSIPEEFVMLPGEERPQVQLCSGGAVPGTQSAHTQTDLFGTSMPLQVSLPTYAQKLVGLQSCGVGGWSEYADFPPKSDAEEILSRPKEPQSGSRRILGGLFGRGDNSISAAQHKQALLNIQKLQQDLKRSSEECNAQQGHVKKQQQQVEELKEGGKRCRAALEKHKAMLEASEARCHHLESSHASKEAAWQEEMGVLNERCAEASFSKDLLESDLLALKEENDQLRASLPDSDARASFHPTLTTASPVLCFETGFGSIEQRAILESIALRAEGLARMLLERRLVDTAEVYSAFFTSGQRSFVDLNHKQYPPAFRAALQHFLLEKMLKSALNLEWPDVAAIDSACHISSEPGVAAAGEQVRAAMFRAWYLVACKSQEEEQGAVSRTQAVLYGQVSQLALQVAASIFPNFLPQHAVFQSWLLGLAFDFVKLRLLVGCLQPSCPGIQAIFKFELGPFDPENCDEPLLNLYAQQHMADAESRFILFCLRPGLAYLDQHGKMVALVKQQVVTLVGTG